MGGELIVGDFVFFVDSDMILPRDLVADCLLRCEAGNVDALIVPEISIGEGFWAKCKIRERMCYLGVPGMEAPRFIRTTTYRRLGGWVEGAGAFDDWAFLGRLLRHGCRVSRSEVNLWHAEGKLSLASLFRKKYRMGKTVITGELSQEGSGLMIAQLSPYRFVALFNRVRPQSDFAEIFGVFLMKTIEGLAIYLGKALD
jgi:arabinofuranan 3-O-arabinosyltransferase